MRTFSITDVGMVRQVNQDYVFEGGRPLGILRNLFVVADGMGGHQAGDYASKYTVEVLQRELEKSQGEDIERVLVNAIKTANREIIREASKDEHLKGMGTTVVAATIMNQMMVFCECGRQSSLSDQSRNTTVDERPFTGRRDGTSGRYQTGRSKASPG